jgi:hypothetical protein
MLERGKVMNVNSARNSLVRARNLRNARKSRSSKVISSHASLKTSTSSTSTTNKTTSTSSTSSTTSTTKTKQIAMYEKVESKADEIQSLVAKMIDIGKMEYTDDETGEKAKENDKSSMVSYIKDFAEDYNTVHDALSDIGGSSNLAFKKTLESIVTSNKSALKEIGVTVDNSGDITVDETKLKNADEDKVKSLFATSGGFADKISTKMETIESTAASTVTVLNKLYGTTSTYNTGSTYNSSYYNSYGSSSSWYI